AETGDEVLVALDAVAHSLAPRAQLGLLELARRVPRRRVRVPGGDHLVGVVERNAAAFHELDDVRSLQRSVDLPVVVVAGCDEAADACSSEALLGKRDPPRNAVDDDPPERLLARPLVVEGEQLVPLAED